MTEPDFDECCKQASSITYRSAIKKIEDELGVRRVRSKFPREDFDTLVSRIRRNQEKQRKEIWRNASRKLLEVLREDANWISTEDPKKDFEEITNMVSDLVRQTPPRT